MSDAGAGAGRRITVRSVSCRGVRSFVPFQKPPLYAAVSLGGRREKTQADPDGGECPDWDGAVFAFDLDGAGAGDDGLLQFEVKAQVPLLGNRLVGTACVPVADLGGGDGAAPRHVSYQVCAPDGKPNGSLSFAYAITGGSGGASAYQQSQLYAAPNGALPEQDVSSCCAPPSSAAYPPPATPNFAPHSGSYQPPPPVSAPLYPPVQGLPPTSTYPPTPPPLLTVDSLFLAPNFAPKSSYPPPPALATAYPTPPSSCTACSAPPAQHISSYPPPPPSCYPPPPPSCYPPPAPRNQESPASYFPTPTSSYPPPPPPPEFGSEYPILLRSIPSPAPSSVDRALPYMAPPFQDSAIAYPELTVPPLPSGGSYYPSSARGHPGQAGRIPCYYPQPGTRYS